MAQEAVETNPDLPPEHNRINPSAQSSSNERSITDPNTEQHLSRSLSSSRLNAGAPEFIPRPPTTVTAGANGGGHQRIVKMIHVFHTPPPPLGSSVGVYDYFAGGAGDFVQAPADSDSGSSARDGLCEDIVQKVTKQVEYYFSDANLATTEHLMRFISKDPEGFVPISVIASFKKIKALMPNNVQLSNALRTSAKLVVSDDGKKVRRLHSFTEADVDELQSRIVVAENLPEDHCYQNLMKIFSAVGSVRTIRTCYPQTPNGTTNPTNRSSKLDALFSNKLHAFVEYETVEDAEKALSELNDEGNWSGLRLRLLNKCMAKQGATRGRKAGHEGDGTGEEEDILATNQSNEKQPDDPSQPSESFFDLVGDDYLNERETGGGRRGRGRGRGRGRPRVQYHNNNNHHRGGSCGHGHPIGTPPSAHLMHSEQPTAHRQPPGPRMPDGTRGFTMGRGKPITTSSTVTSS